MSGKRCLTVMIGIVIITMVPVYVASESCKPRAVRTDPEYLATRTISDLAYGIRHNIRGLVTSAMKERARSDTHWDSLVDWDGVVSKNWIAL